MGNYKYVYNNCLSLFMELQKSDDNKKLQIYDLMLECIKLNFPEITTKKNIKEVEEVLKISKEIETLDEDKVYGTVSWCYLLHYIGDVYSIGYKVVYYGANDYEKFKESFNSMLIELMKFIVNNNSDEKAMNYLARNDVGVGSYYNENKELTQMIFNAIELNKA
ncbi:hypothetical protein F372_049 [Campylobacter phage F372]|uniref:Uncharacterized protein n=1 Tax=Campylobacter phage F372 TaxID=2794375 RepID=A0A7T3KHJ2_9CAUD|nr:hypothetical protein F372_049 [Campylobacter phage F372]